MKNQSPSPNDDSQVSLSEKLQDFFDRYRWTYLLGWVYIAGISLVIKFVGPAIFANLTFTGWSLEDLTDFHVTFGSICPDEC